MKHISEVVSVQVVKKQENIYNVSDIDEEKTKRVLNRLFVRFEGIFNKFWVGIKSQEHLNSIKAEWLESLMLAKVTDVKLLHVGLMKAKANKREFLPKVSEFIAWCTEIDPVELGMPDCFEAFNLAVKINSSFSGYKIDNKLLENVINHAMSQIGSFDFRGMHSEKARPLFARAYELSCKKLIAGELDNCAIAIDSKKTEIQGRKDMTLSQYSSMTSAASALTAMRSMLKIDKGES